MYHSESIKVEYGSKWPVALCHACLSAERALSPLGTLADMYRKICDINNMDALSEVSLCWECTAMLKRAKRFKDRVTNAQSVLQLLNNCYITPEIPQCLSTLVTKKATVIYTGLKDSNNDVKPVPNVPVLEIELKPFVLKNESEYIKPNFLVSDEYFDQDDDVQSIEYKQEDIKEKKRALKQEPKEVSINTKRRLAYRTFLNPTKLYHEAVTEEKIDPSDVYEWIERERNSPYYKKITKKCDKCLRAIKHRDTLKKHDSLYHCESIGPVVCSICECRFADRPSLEAHTALHYVTRRCNLCQYRCYTARHMYRHINSHKKTVQCLKCDACYSNARQFFVHYKALHSHYECDQCGRRCKSRRLMESHIRSHGPLECKLCNVKFKEPRHLAGHNQMKHAGHGGEAAFCVRCDRQFHTVALFRRHVNTSVAHADERHKVKRKKEAVPCPVCGKLYARKYTMENHHRHVHLNQSRYYCLLCEKPFMNSTTFLYHQRITHEGYVKEKNKLCAICGRGFAERRILERHMYTHTGERPFACAHCDARFTQRGALTAHLRAAHQMGLAKQ